MPLAYGWPWSAPPDPNGTTADAGPAQPADAPADEPGAPAADQEPAGPPAPSDGPEQPGLVPGDAKAQADGAESGELPASLSAGAVPTPVRWSVRPRRLGPDGALGTPSGGGVYVVYLRGVPVAAQITRNFGRDLRRRIAAGGARPPGISISYGIVADLDSLTSREMRSLVRGLRRSIGLPVAPAAR
jgi:hypothetical protein